MKPALNVMVTLTESDKLSMLISNIDYTPLTAHFLSSTVQF